MLGAVASPRCGRSRYDARYGTGVTTRPRPDESVNSGATAERLGTTGGWLESMLDSASRPLSDRAPSRRARSSLGRVDPIVVSAAAMVVSIWAAVAAWRGAPALAVGLWVAGQVAAEIGDPTARGTRARADLAGLAGAVSRSVSVVAIPIGVAAGIGDVSGWVAAAVVLAALQVHVASTGHPFAPHYGAGAPIPRVERITFIVLFALALALPDAAVAVFWMTAAAAAAIVVSRLWRATRSPS